MNTIKVIGMEAAQRKIKSIPRQAKFAASKANNDLALDIQEHEVKTQLPSKLTLRSKGTPWYKPGTRFGINIKFASISNLTAIVGSRADWLKLQEEGGTKSAGSHRVAIPTAFWKKREEIMAANKKPRKILAAKLAADAQKFDSELAREEADSRSFKQGWVGAKLLGRKAQSDRKKRIAKLKRMRNASRKAASIAGMGFGGKPFEAKVGGTEGIFVRTTKARNPIKALFWFVDSARVKAALQFKASGEKILQKNYIKRFGKRLNEAMNK